MSMRKSSRTSCNYSDKDDSDSCTLCEAFKLQQAIYLQVLRTTVAMFAADYIYEETTVMTGVQQLKLKASERSHYSKVGRKSYASSQKEKAQTLPPIVENEEAEVELKSMEKETQPPKPYTEGTLITAMKTAGKRWIMMKRKKFSKK